MAKSTDPNRQDFVNRPPPQRPFSAWPSWRFHPDYGGPDAAGREDPKFARIFNGSDEVPDGWTSAPGKPDEVKPPTAAEIKLEAALAELAALKAGGAAPPKKPTKKQAEAREAKIAKLIAAGYDKAETEACDDATLDLTLAEEAKAQAS